ncbi:metalloendoproteinase 2-MMP-like [Impatiens glandulifera]|uniref:metalloendoproteinase 2-MMP-like n=1 Tax=Impatiens glandulifera TaxID=253017 RepID=UPI001FB04C21|nr:metalloendoproteinase 2-MMP-like [Impatiens glandulifera]
MKLLKAHLPSLCSFISLFLILVSQTSFSIETSNLVQVRRYLIKYGYLNSVSSAYQLREKLDDDLAQAIKKYQSFSHLDSSGILDERTLAQMAMPRCDMPDFVKGTPVPHGMKQVILRSNSSYYTFTASKWSKFNLTWALEPGTRADAMRPIKVAFDRWMSVSKFNFLESPVFNNSDLQISFVKIGDGSGGTLANAGGPPSGKLHFDVDEKWVDGVVAGAFDIGTLGLHEIGHLLGLAHSDVKSAIMWPYFSRGVTKDLDPDDIAGIRALYP